MTEPAEEERPVGWAPPPTIPGEILVRVTHPDDPPETIDVAGAKAGQKARWKCACGEKSRKALPMETLARAELYAHYETCRLNPRVAAGVAAAKAASRGGKR